MESMEKYILRSASNLFFRYGYKKTSMSEIANDVGIAKGTLYNYFVNKEDLFLRTSKAKNLEIIENISREMAKIDRADEKLMHFFRYLVKCLRKTVEEYSMSESGIKEWMSVSLNLKSNIAMQINNIAKILQEGISQDIFKPCDCNKKAQILRRISKAFLPEWVMMDQKKANLAIQEIFELIFDGLYYS